MNDQPVRGHYRVRGLDLAYHTWGDKTDPVLLAVHGFMDHGLAYAPTVRHLKNRYYVVAPDVRGHGASGWIGDGGYYHFYDYFHDVRVLIETLAIDHFSIVAHSMGGSIATGLGALFKDRVDRIVLLEGMGPPFTDLADSVDRLRIWSDALGWERVSGSADERRRRRRVMPDVEDAASRLCRVNPRIDPAIALELAGTFTEPGPDGSGVVWCYDPLHRTPGAKPFLAAEAEAYWRALTMPVLSLYGSDGWPPDRLEERHAAIANLKVERVEGAGHNIHHDRPDVVAAAIDGFVAGGAAVP